MRVENFTLEITLAASASSISTAECMYNQKILAPHELYKKCSNRFWRLQWILLRSTSSIQWNFYVCTIQTKNTSRPMSCIVQKMVQPFFRVSNGDIIIHSIIAPNSVCCALPKSRFLCSCVCTCTYTHTVQ